jgi:hypothetical protein
VPDGDDNNLVMFASALETGEPDPRQAKFLGVAGTMSGEGFELISMQGFRASQVDLAWITDEIDDYVSTMPGVTAADVVELIGKELPRVVQRLKGYSITVDEWPESMKLSIETKDDLGWYTYEISMYLNVATEDEGDEVEDEAED